MAFRPVFIAVVLAFGLFVSAFLINRARPRAAALLPVRDRWPAVWRDVGYLIGWLAVVVGLAGVIYHLDSQFFYQRTVCSLTYAAPRC